MEINPPRWTLKLIILIFYEVCVVEIHSIAIMVPIPLFIYTSHMSAQRESYKYKVVGVSSEVYTFSYH